MPVTLTTPMATVALDKARVVAIKIEDNPSEGTHWIEVWVAVGREVGGDFIQHADPESGGAAAYYFKIEDGCHPLIPGQGLYKCPACGRWDSVSGACTTTDCEGAMVAYDGHARLTAVVPTAGVSIRDAIGEVVYGFLLSEDVGDGPLLPASA